MIDSKEKLFASATRMVAERQGEKGGSVPAMAVAAADVLALLGEIESIKARLCVCRDCQGQGEVYSGHSTYEGYFQPPEPIMDVCGTCGGDGVLGPLEDFESLAAERDQLKIEIEQQAAQFKSWQESHHRNYVAVAEERDELKAENEALRKRAPSAEIIWCDCGDGHPTNSYGAGFMDANNGVCANCDAANNVGADKEQSHG